MFPTSSSHSLLFMPHSARVMLPRQATVYIVWSSGGIEETTNGRHQGLQYICVLFYIQILEQSGVYNPYATDYSIHLTMGSWELMYKWDIRLHYSNGYPCWQATKVTSAVFHIHSSASLHGVSSPLAPLAQLNGEIAISEAMSEQMSSFPSFLYFLNLLRHRIHTSFHRFRCTIRVFRRMHFCWHSSLKEDTRGNGWPWERFSRKDMDNV